MRTQIPKWARKTIIGVMVFAGIIIFLGILYPKLFYVVANILWTVGFTLAILLVIVGALTMLGRKKEASAIIDLALEGSLGAIDFIDFLKELRDTFIAISKKVILMVTPYISYILAAIVYLIVIILYKAYGRENDVLAMTIVMTIVLTIMAGFLNRPSAYQNQLLKKYTYLNSVFQVFRRNFIDGFEVALLVLFLTIDSTNLFFLPEALNVPLTAQYANYDFMERGFSTYQVDVTVKLVMIGLILEFIRNLIRLLAEARRYYTDPERYIPYAVGGTKTELIKATVSKTVEESKDEIMRFTAFTSLMIFVFLFFPRLKLVALIAATATNLLLDIVMPSRLTFRGQEDLMSRTFNKVFKTKSKVTYE